MEREDQTNVPNVEAQAFTEPLKIVDMPKLEGAAEASLSSEGVLE